MFKNLQQKFDGRTNLPVEIQDICDALVEMGYQDDIRVVPERMDISQLAGTYVQWTEHGEVYGEPKLVSLIIYPSNVSVMSQRLICTKELVHVCDAHVTQTSDPDEIDELAQALCQKSGLSDQMQMSGIKYATDILAQSKGVMLLFPKAARIIARQRIQNNDLTLSELENILQMPTGVIEDMLDDEWEGIAELISKI